MDSEFAIYPTPSAGWHRYKYALELLLLVLGILFFLFLILVLLIAPKTPQYGAFLLLPIPYIMVRVAKLSYRMAKACWKISFDEIRLSSSKLYIPASLTFLGRVGDEPIIVRYLKEDGYLHLPLSDITAIYDVHDPFQGRHRFLFTFGVSPVGKFASLFLKTRQTLVLLKRDIEQMEQFSNALQSCLGDRFTKCSVLDVVHF